MFKLSSNAFSHLISLWKSFWRQKILGFCYCFVCKASRSRAAARSNWGRGRLKSFVHVWRESRSKGFVRFQLKANCFVLTPHCLTLISHNVKLLRSFCVYKIYLKKINQASFERRLNAGWGPRKIFGGEICRKNFQRFGAKLICVTVGKLKKLMIMCTKYMIVQYMCTRM